MNFCLVTLLWAIAAVETGHNDAAIGRAGERSQYQIMEVVWRQHEPQLRHDRCRGEAATKVATKHLTWLTKQVGADVTALASAWNQGATGHRRRGPNDYARRVTALYWSRMPAGNETNLDTVGRSANALHDDTR
jgi:hypothetical protein